MDIGLTVEKVLGVLKAKNTYFEPGLSSVELGELREHVASPCTELLLFAGATRKLKLSNGAEIDFTGKLGGGLFSRAVGLHDMDDLWIAVPTSDVPSGAAVVFQSHDPPVVVFAYDSISEFMLDIVTLDQDVFENSIRRQVRRIFANPIRPLDFETVEANADLKEFQTAMASSCEMYDLRDKTHAGFSFLNFDYRSACPLAQMGHKLVFALRTKRSWISRVRDHWR